MPRQKAFRIASGFALVAWAGTALVALLVATSGVIGLMGWGDYRYQVEVPVPGLSVDLASSRPGECRRPATFAIRSTCTTRRWGATTSCSTRGNPQWTAT